MMAVSSPEDTSSLLMKGRHHYEQNNVMNEQDTMQTGGQGQIGGQADHAK